MTAVHIIIASFVLLIIGVLLLRRSNSILKKGIRVQAKVVNNRRPLNAGISYPKRGSGVGIYYPQMLFYTKEGKEIIAELKDGYNPPLNEGTILEILYDSDDPTVLREYSTYSIKVIPFALIILGSVLLIFGITQAI